LNYLFPASGGTVVNKFYSAKLNLLRLESITQLKAYVALFTHQSGLRNANAKHFLLPNGNLLRYVICVNQGLNCIHRKKIKGE